MLAHAFAVVVIWGRHRDYQVREPNNSWGRLGHLGVAALDEVITADFAKDTPQLSQPDGRRSMEKLSR